MALEVCGWSVTAGFPSPAADHTRKRIDLNEHLIRNPDATHVFRVKGGLLWREGYKYKKAGIMLGDISAEAMVQGDLLEPVIPGDSLLMKAMDGLNARFGRGTVKLSDRGLRSEWYMRQERRSPDYTSDWTQLPCAY